MWLIQKLWHVAYKSFGMLHTKACHSSCWNSYSLTRELVLLLVLVEAFMLRCIDSAASRPCCRRRCVSRCIEAFMLRCIDSAAYRPED